VLACVALGGCGRIAFDPLGGGGDANGGDANGGGDSGAADTMAPVQCVAGMIVCDSFEQGLTTVGWNRSTLNGTMDVDTTRAHRGTTSIYAHTNPIPSPSANSPSAIVSSGQGLPITGTLHARAWIYVASPHPTGEFDQVINFADVAGDGISVGARNGVIAANDYTDVAYAESGTAQLPLDRWACLQLSIPSGTAGTTRVYLDGAEVTDVALSKSTTQPAPTRIEVGVQWVATVTDWPATDVWFDDVIVDDQPITCAQ
jgi:hypothetical protein